MKKFQAQAVYGSWAGVKRYVPVVGVTRSRWPIQDSQVCEVKVYEYTTWRHAKLEQTYRVSLFDQILASN